MGPTVNGQYFDNTTPVNGSVLCQIPRSNDKDIELALDAAHAAKDAWGKTSVTERSGVLLKIADLMETNLAMLAEAETWDNGKPIRETKAADIPLAIDHFRYYAGVIRAQEGTMSEIDGDTIAYHFQEPLGVVWPNHPMEFPDPDGGMETGTCIGYRELCYSETSRANTCFDSCSDGIDWRSTAWPVF